METMKSQLKKNNASTPAKSAVKGVAKGLTAMTVAELAVIGAAGYVVWKNRDKIQDFL